MHIDGKVAILFSQRLNVRLTQTTVGPKKEQQTTVILEFRTEKIPNLKFQHIK